MITNHLSSVSTMFHSLVDSPGAIQIKVVIVYNQSYNTESNAFNHGAMYLMTLVTDGRTDPLSRN